jgi:DNA-binding NarL/FixJ family response regulator
MSGPVIRVVLADDHDSVREGLRLLIDAQTDMAVVGEVQGGEAVLDSVATLRPDVLVLDLSMRQMTGLTATRAVRSMASPPAIVILTRHDDKAYVRELTEAGAAAYVLKQSPSSEFLSAVRTAASGGRYRDAALTSTDSIDGAHADLRVARPTDREIEVLRLMAAGHSNKDIAVSLAISVKTVEVHRANAMRKLGLQGRADVVRYAVLQGWLAAPVDVAPFGTS